MGEISSELKSFKSSVESSIGSMNSSCTTILDKIQEMTSIAQTTKSGIDTYYASSNTAALTRRFERVNDYCSRISSSVNGDLKGTISEADALCKKIKELEDLNTEIETQEGIVSANSGDEDGAVSKRIAAKNKINELNRSFTEKHKQALDDLSSLKSKDSTLEFVQYFTSLSKIDPDKLEYGTFEQREFTASNGITVKYWLYVPDYGTDVEGLPCMLYMHGGSKHQSISYEQSVKYGLGSMIYKKEITPSGVVIVPCCEDFSEEGIKALKEVTDHVVAEQNCDTNRISVSGHSYGAHTAYNLINTYPDYFSCCVAISGKSKVTEAFTGMKVWSFVGTLETGSSWTSYNSCVQAVNEINQIGGYAKHTALQTGHPGTNAQTYANEYESPDGVVENPMDWAFRQEKA